MSKKEKKKDVTNRTSSASMKSEVQAIQALTQSGVGSTTSGDSKGKVRSYPIWPEFSDADINAEKWTQGDHEKEKKKPAEAPVKGKERGKSPNAQFFDDPEGKVEMPPNNTMSVHSWIRVQDYVVLKVPVVVEDMEEDFDLLTANEHLFGCQMMRLIISQIVMLWHIEKRRCKQLKDSGASPEVVEDARWKPWEHIYSNCKAGKGHVPLHNPYGKYIVRLFWLGCWRKIVVDDLLPINEEGVLLLPRTPVKHELWPLLLSKAILKVASINYRNHGSNQLDLTDFSLIHTLTGWIPEVTPCCRINEMWHLLKKILPEWKYPKEATDNDDSEEKSGNMENSRVASSVVNPPAPEPAAPVKPSAMEEGSHSRHDHRSGKEAKSSKEKKEKKEESKDRAKSESEPHGEAEPAVAKDPECVVFVTVDYTTPSPVPLSVLREMATGSEVLRNVGLSQMLAHPVFVQQTRSCPLVPVPAAPPVPRWKLIRPRHNSPAQDAKPQKPHKWLEISSPFLGAAKPKAPEKKSAKFSASLKELAERNEEERAEEGREDDATTTTATGAGGDAGAASVDTDVAAANSPFPSQVSQDGKLSAAAADARPDNATPATDVNKEPEAGPAQEQKLQWTAVKKALQSHMFAVTVLKGEFKAKNEATLPKNAWIDFDDFCKAFKSVVIFHKTNTYKHNSETSDVKPVVTSNLVSAAPSGSKKGSAHINQAPSQTNVKPGAIGSTLTPDRHGMSRQSNLPAAAAASGIIASPTPAAPLLRTSLENRSKPLDPTDPSSADHHPPQQAAGQQAPSAEDRTSTYIMVDSTEQVELILSLSALVYWPGIDVKPVSDKESVTGAASDVMSIKSLGHGAETRASLVVEPHSWLDVTVRRPLMHISTIGVHGAGLILPPGRNVLRLTVTSSLGYHLHICSSTGFVHGDEETIMAPLQEESERFKQVTKSIMSCLEACTTSFDDPAKWAAAKRKLRRVALPNQLTKKKKKSRSEENLARDEIFNRAFFNLLGSVISEGKAVDAVKFVFRVFTLDFDSQIEGKPRDLQIEGKRRDSQIEGKPRDSQVEGKPAEPAGEMLGRNATTEEEMAAKVVTRALRMVHVIKVMRAYRDRQSREHAAMRDALAALKTAIQANPVTYGSTLLRKMLKDDPALLQYYPFHDDELNKICYVDYSDVYNEQPAKSWFVLFRGTFHASEKRLSVPKLYSPLNNCNLHVVDNDTGLEVKRIFHKPAPYVYKPNKSGYTCVAQVRSGESPIAAGKWKLRMIGLQNPLPAPPQPISSQFTTKDIRGYYIPNPERTVLKYRVSCTSEQITSIQMETSKKDVYVLLQITDYDEVVASAKGKGHVFVPYFRFSPKSPALVEGATDEAEDQPVEQTHDYAIKVTVLHNSWPLTEEQLAHVETLKKQEKEQFKLFASGKDVVEATGSLNEKQSGGTVARNSLEKGKGKGGKGGGEKGGKEKKGEKESNLSRPPSEHNVIGSSKAHWILRVVCEVEGADDVDVKKDTLRQQEIRAMKQAWEAMDVGRAEKAQQSRMKYLNELRASVKQTDEAAELSASDKENEFAADSATDLGDETTSLDRRSTLDSKDANADDISTILSQIKLPFRPCEPEQAKAVFYSADRLMAAESERRRELQRVFSEQQERSSEFLELNRRYRLNMKEQQLENCQRFQTQSDHARTDLLKPRNQFRTSMIEDLRFEQEKLEAAAAASQAATPAPEKQSAGKRKK